VSSTEDKAKLTAFVLGELDPAEARELVRRMETDPKLRFEVEALSVLNAKVAAHYNFAADDDTAFELSAKQLEKIRSAARREGEGRAWKKGFVWGGMFIAASIAGLMFFRVQLPSDKLTPVADGPRVGGMKSPEPAAEEKRKEQVIDKASPEKMGLLGAYGSKGAVSGAGNVGFAGRGTQGRALKQDAAPAEGYAAVSEAEDQAAPVAAKKMMAKPVSRESYYILNVDPDKTMAPADIRHEIQIALEGGCLSRHDSVGENMRLDLGYDGKGKLVSMGVGGKAALSVSQAETQCLMRALGKVNGDPNSTLKVFLKVK